MNWIRRFWRGVVRRELLVLIVALILLCLALAGCAFPVRNENNDKPLLVAATGVSVPQADGSVSHNPALPQPQAGEYKPGSQINWMLILQGAAALLVGTTGFGAVSKIRTLTAAVRDSTAFGEDMERAETDEEVSAVKAKNAARQASNNTFKTIAKVRGKS